MAARASRPRPARVSAVRVKRRGTINIRVSKEVKRHLQELARQEGKTLSTMLRESASAEAHKVLKRYARS